MICGGIGRGYKFYKIFTYAIIVADDIDMQMIEEIKENDTDESTSWEEYKTEREERNYNGNISLRIPKDLHRDLVGMAKE